MHQPLLEMIDDIIASPKIESYLIGYTAQPALKRYKQYGEGFRGLIVLRDKMTQDEASDLECELQRALCADKRHRRYLKYHPEKRDGPVYPSRGGAKHDPLLPIHSVYLVWF